MVSVLKLISKPTFQYDPLVVITTVGNAFSSDPVVSVVCLYKVFSNANIDVAIFLPLFVLSQFF